VRVQLGARRAQLRRDDDALAAVAGLLQRLEESRLPSRRIVNGRGAQFCFTL
jgi:hypothetical protein